MVPIKLELENFLAYRRPQPLDLTGLHVACLVGANGAGKSSLLDAMTWALWGRARARRDDELIHGEETEMQVRLTFLLDGTSYRVTRYRSRQGRGTSELGLEVQDGETWRTLTEPTMRATQDKVNRILRLDYDTFINSAFLAQGRADEFTRKTPGERKSILGEILALHLWQAYEDRARKYLRSLEDQTRMADAQIEEIDRDLARENEYRAALDTVRVELDGVIEQVRLAEEQFRVLDEARRRRDDLRARHNDLNRRSQDGLRELERVEREHQQRRTRLDNLFGVQATQSEIEQGYFSLQEARLREREFSDRLMQQSDLERSRAEWQAVITAARTALETERRTLVEQRARLERAAAPAGDEQVFHEVQEKIKGLESRQQEIEGWRTQLTGWREERSNLQGINQGLKAEMDHLKQQIKDIEATTDPVCPLCGQELGDEHRTELLATLRERGGEKGDIWRTNQTRIEELDAQIAHLQRELERGEGELRNLPPLRERLARLEEAASRAREAGDQLAEVDARLGQIDAHLAAGDYAPDEQAALGGIEAQMAALGYDRAAHQSVQDYLASLGGFESRKQELDRALDLIPELEASLADLEQQAANWQARLAEDQAQLDEWAGQITELDTQLVDYVECERELNQLRLRESEVRTRLGAAQQKVNSLEGQRQRRQELLDRRAQYADEQAIYDELRQAFGKDGVPAMIIEAAIPEIEKEANQILTQMTDGQMHIQFDTQREKVTGGVKETLDIRISDALGTRDYSTFSGGESFRVDFSIRLALSRLLARRAGAQLRTLIVDEGFGSQDAMGRERLVQAINSIQNEFDLILVITHIDELKDAFPARIEVTKLSDGSHLEIV